MCGFSARLRCGRQAWLHDEGAARVDRHHAVVDSHGCLQRPRQADRARVVDQDVDPAEGGDRLLDGRCDLVLCADVDDERQRPAPGLLDRACRRVDRSGKLGMWLGGLRRHDHVGAVAGGAQRDRKADPTACTGNEECAVAQRHGIGSGRARMDHVA